MSQLTTAETTPASAIGGDATATEAFVAEESTVSSTNSSVTAGANDEKEGVDVPPTRLLGANGEFIHITRKSKTKEERLAASGGKAGNQGKFKGDVAAFLETFRTRYEVIKGMEDRKNRALNEFWFDLCGQFWTRFSWEMLKEMWGSEVADWDKARMMRAVNDMSTLALSQHDEQLLTVI